jgi:hypothetical protein
MMAMKTWRRTTFDGNCKMMKDRDGDDDDDDT